MLVLGVPSLLPVETSSAGVVKTLFLSLCDWWRQEVVTSEVHSTTFYGSLLLGSHAGIL